jgi:hypothetical protein
MGTLTEGLPGLPVTEIKPPSPPAAEFPTEMGTN